MSTGGNTTITNNVFLHLPSTPQKQIPTILFFITGNPGLIGYYHQFLNLIRHSTIDVTQGDHTRADGNESKSTTSPISIGDRCVVAGFSLGGFDLPPPQTPTRSGSSSSGTSSVDSTEGNALVGVAGDSDDLLYPRGFQQKPWYGLQDQIELCYARLTALVTRVEGIYGSNEDGGIFSREGNAPDRNVHEQRKVNVILMGHSVGTYIALEMVRTHFLRHEQDETDLSSAVSVPMPTTGLPRMRITTALLLTPTILDLAHSPSGRIATPLLTYLPFLPDLLQLSSTGLTSILSISWLKWLVSKVTGMPGDSDALETTVGFLRSRRAVKQALALARDELGMIAAGRWGEEVWGGSEEDGDIVHGDVSKKGDTIDPDGGEVISERRRKWTAPKLYLWFAREDHWVADATREEIVKLVDEKYGVEVEVEKRNRPVVVIDQDEGLVHAWCIAQNEIVARRVGSWLGEALRKTDTLV